MRLAGFFMQREETAFLDDNADAGGVVDRHAGYVWVSRPHRSSGHMSMLHGLVGALDNQEMQPTILGTMRGGGGGGGEGRPPNAKDVWYMMLGLLHGTTSTRITVSCHNLKVAALSPLP